MPRADGDNFMVWIGRLCGQIPRPATYISGSEILENFPSRGIESSQLNEFLLMVQLDRVSEGFFKYVFGESIETFDEFKRKIDEFRIKSMVKFGHVKFSFKKLSNRDFNYIEREFSYLETINENVYKNRHDNILSIETIKPEKTHYLGYLTPDTEEVEKIRKQGKFNHECYLDYDHMDVYVATSMRREIDFWNIARFVSQVFDSIYVKNLKLRYFDPTQAYCDSRVDKGLVEALMLKRAKCTIYMAGESDSFGKDSELAATLAQGKPVIAYVPKFEGFERWKSEFVDEALISLYSDEDDLRVAMRYLQTYYSEGAWSDGKVQGWLSSNPDVDEVWKLIYDKAQDAYDNKANLLLDKHPLGIQVNLNTGVANGVLVARKVEQCAKLVREILLNELKFDVVDLEGGEGAAELRERDTNSLYRVVTEDRHLVNSFWNFYLRD